MHIPLGDLFMKNSLGVVVGNSVTHAVPSTLDTRDESEEKSGDNKALALLLAMVSSKTGSTSIVTPIVMMRTPRDFSICA